MIERLMKRVDDLDVRLKLRRFLLPWGWWHRVDRTTLADWKRLCILTYIIPLGFFTVIALASHFIVGTPRRVTPGVVIVDAVELLAIIAWIVLLVRGTPRWKAIHREIRDQLSKETDGP